MKVCIIGTREYKDLELVRRMLDELSPTLIICKRVTKASLPSPWLAATEWAREHNVKVSGWTKPTIDRMVRWNNPDLVLVFKGHEHLKDWVKRLLKQARERDIPIRVLGIAVKE